jgi:transcriptional regulator with XRE-family HTH domain
MPCIMLDMSNHQEETLGARCRAARGRAHLSQEEASYRLRTMLPARRSPKASTVSRIESGAIAEPEPYVIAGLAQVYGVSITALDPSYADEVRMLGELFAKCAPWDSNPEPAGSLLTLV